MKCKETDHPVTIVMYFHLLAVPIMSFILLPNWSSTTDALSFMPEWQPIGWYEWGLGIIIGVFSVLAQIFMAYAIHQEDASIVTPIKYIGAILAIAIGYYRFREALEFWAIIGIFLVIIGVPANTILRKGVRFKKKQAKG